MDTDDGGKKEAKKPQFKEASEPSSKRWLRSDAKKSWEKAGVGTGMNSVSGEKKSEIDQDEKSADGGAKKRKLSTTTEHTTPKRSLRSSKSNSDETGQSNGSKMNSDSVEKKTNVDTGKGENRKLSIEQGGSEKPSSSHHEEHPSGTISKENGGVPNLNLPNELMTKIIDLVPISQWASLESVSHQFQDIVHGLWRELRGIRLTELIYSKEKNEADPCQGVEAILEKFLIRAPNVASIIGFEECRDWRKATIRLPTVRLLSKFQHLESIDFSGGCMVTARNFATFLESSSSRQYWKRLDVASGIGGSGIHGTMGHEQFGSQENQSILNLEYFKFNAHTICNFCPYLPIQWSGLKTLVIVHHVKAAKEILSIIRQCTQLHHLQVEIPECGKGNGQPSYDDFMQAVADLENLSILKITGDSSRDNASFFDALLVLIQRLGGRRIITDLSLKNYNYSDQILDAIIDHLPRLKALDLNATNCTTPSIERLINRMGQLESLVIESYGFSVDGTIVRSIGGNMSALQYLHLDYPKCISEDFNILGNLRKLKELCIKGTDVESLTIETWIGLGFGSCLESLQFELPFQVGISPEAMGNFLKNLPRLSSLKMSWVADDAILYAVAESCPNLVKLSIYLSSSISSAGIQSVIDRCSQLKILNVTNDFEWFPESLTVGKYRKITFMSEFGA